MSLMKKLLKTGSIAEADVLATSSFLKNKDTIELPVPIMNLAFSGSFERGPSTGLIQFAGPSKHFKTNLGLVVLKAFQDKYPDGVTLFYDSEFGAAQGYFETFGIDETKIIHIPIMNIEELKFDIMQKLQAITRGEDKVFIFIDSVGNLASKKEVEDAINEKAVADMTRAKQLKSLWRMVTPYLTKLNITCVAINHTYDTMEMHSKKVVSGGCLVQGTSIIMADGSLQAIENVHVGDLVKTMQGPKEVTHIWNPDTLIEGVTECFEVEFSDGYKVQCSYNHPFLIELETGQHEWVAAKNLQENMKIVSV